MLFILNIPIFYIRMKVNDQMSEQTVDLYYFSGEFVVINLTTLKKI